MIQELVSEREHKDILLYTSVRALAVSVRLVALANRKLALAVLQLSNGEREIASDQIRELLSDQLADAEKFSDMVSKQMQDLLGARKIAAGASVITEIQPSRTQADK